VQKTATAVAYCRRGKGNLKVNGRPLEMVEPRVLQYKLKEPIQLLGQVSQTISVLLGKVQVVYALYALPMYLSVILGYQPVCLVRTA